MKEKDKNDLQNQEEQLVLKVAFGKDGGITVDMPDEDQAVTALAGHVITRFSARDMKPLDFLLGVVVHALAMETSGGLEKEFISNIRKHTPVFRKYYGEAAAGLRGNKKPVS